MAICSRGDTRHDGCRRQASRLNLSLPDLALIFSKSSCLIPPAHLKIGSRVVHK